MIQNQNPKFKHNTPTSDAYSTLRLSENIKTKPEAVQLYLMQAEQYCKQKNWQLAIMACQQAVQIDPNLAEAYKIWGNALQKMGDNLRAMGCYAKALEIKPDWEEVHANLGSIYAKEQQWKQAINYYQKAIAINPKFAGAYRNLARVWREVGQPSEAAKCTYLAMILEPDKSSAPEFYNMGNQLWEQGLRTEALTCYRNAIRLKPNYLEAYQKLADTLASLGEWQESSNYYRKVVELKAAIPQSNPQKTVPYLLPNGVEGMAPVERRVEIPALPGQPSVEPTINLEGTGSRVDRREALKQGASINPNSAEFHSQLGSKYAEQQQWSQAIASYKQALRINPQFAAGYRNLARVLTRTGQREESAQCWYRALTLEPNWAKAEEHFNLGNSLLKQGRKEQAVDCYRRAIQLKPDFSGAYARLGELLSSDQPKQILSLPPQGNSGARHSIDGEQYYRLGQACTANGEWEQAIAHYLRALEFQPNRAQAHHNLADALLKQQRLVEAVSAYNRAIELQPDFSWSHHNLGDALLKLKRPEEAASSYRRAIQLNPKFPWSYYNLAESLGQLGRWSEAASAYDRALQLQPDLPQAREKLNYALSQQANGSFQSTPSSYAPTIQQYPTELESTPRSPSSNGTFGDRKALESQGEEHLKLGNTLAKGGKLDEAITHYQQAIALNPRLLEAYRNLVRVLQKKGNLEAAAEYWYQALSQQPNWASAEEHLRLGNILWSERKGEKAIACYRQAIQLKPSLGEPYYRLAEVLRNEEKWLEAISWYQKATELMPSYWQAYHHLGLIVVRLN